VLDCATTSAPFFATIPCAALAQEPGLAALRELADHLRSMAGDIRAHLDERATASGHG
jgi:hypothetical protein